MTQSTKGVSTMNLESRKLKAALERLCLVVPKRGTLPVLENLRWRVVKGHLELTATDLDNSLHISMPSAAPVIPNSADVLVTAKELYQAVKTESAPNVEIRIHDGKFEVRANNRTLVLPCAEPKNFPQIPDGELSLRGQILSSALETALSKALFCVSTESTRYSTDVVKLEMRGSVFRIVGRPPAVGGRRDREGRNKFRRLLDSPTPLDRLHPQQTSVDWRVLLGPILDLRHRAGVQ